MAFLGIAYLFIGSFDLLHTLAYKGMGVFKSNNANLATELWIIARYIESISLILFLFIKDKVVNLKIVFTLYFLTSLALISSVFYFNIFPDCYIDQQGLTFFKKISEYLICLIFIVSGLVLFKFRNFFGKKIFTLLIGSVITSVIAELLFTFYISVFGISNLIGHLFKIISFYLIYRAFIKTSLINPFELLFKQLKDNEEVLKRERDDLKLALSEIKKLRQIIPICAYCKKVRNDEGYWQQVGDYIHSHLDIDVTHGICPECLKKYFPEVDMSEE